MTKDKMLLILLALVHVIFIRTTAPNSRRA